MANDTNDILSDTIEKLVSSSSQSNVSMQAFDKISSQLADMIDQQEDIIQLIGESQSRARYNSDTRTNSTRRSNDIDSIIRSSRRRSGRYSLADEVEHGLIDTLVGNDFKRRMRDISRKFTEQYGESLSELPSKVAEGIGKNLAESFKQSEAGKAASEAIDKGMSAVFAKASSSLGLGVEGATLESVVSGLASQGASLLGTLGPIALLAAGLYADFKLFEWVLKPTIDGLKKFGESLKDSSNRYWKTLENMLKNNQTYFEQSVNTYVKYPFEILEKAAQELYTTWDNNIRVINSSQQYSQDDLADLMARYAQRLRDDNLSGYVSTTDITNNLSNVLRQGLSGEIAEEFSYLATVLNAAVPTQDFFQYAEAYSSIAANAVRQGKSQVEAIELADDQLGLFASSVLYASRELAGGFSTGLQNASNLFSSAVKISQTARVGDASQIGGVLASVSAIVGAIAPDLASGLVDAIINSATSGNGSTTVALRSLAGINASNSEFIRAIAKDPKKVFGDLFTNLANMQNMANDAYLEVAEGLSSVFGISMDSFARIDFKYLADQINAMNMNSNELNENIANLRAGNTTTTAESLKIQQINKLMIDEGLSYVLGNEEAREIQKHLWDQELANEMMQAEYAINLRGAALDLLTGISNTIKKILHLRMPIGSAIADLSNMGRTLAETQSRKSDIAELLLNARVGSGTNTQEYLDLMGGFSSGVDELTDLVRDTAGITDKSSMSGQKIIGKSEAAKLQANYQKRLLPDEPVIPDTTHTSQQAIFNKLSALLKPDYIESIVKDGQGTYEDWAASATKQGISNIGAVLEEYGLKVEDVKSAIEDYQIQRQVEREQEETKKFNNSITSGFEKLVGTDGVQFKISTLLESVSKTIELFYKQHTSFYNDWVEFNIRHSDYNKAYSYTDVARIQKAEASKSSDAVYALADALTANSVDLNDPKIQTNALLAQILLNVQNILQANLSGGSSGGSSLPDTLSALALGLTNGT